MESNENPLVLNDKTPERLVRLHPLVLLTVSDCVTRRVVRQQKGPVVGGILGTQDGQVTSLEQAFECKINHNEQGDTTLDGSWFSNRLQQLRNVHRATNLDLVGWFTLAPVSGPQTEHLPIHQQLSETYSDSSLLLAFHPISVGQGPAIGEKLPVSVYEPVLDAASEDANKSMQISHKAPSDGVRFKELPYKIKSSDAEMIGVDFVARGRLNATITQSINTTQNAATTPSSTDKSTSKGVAERNSDDGLIAQEEELIVSLTAKANAIRMLRQRVSLLRRYLASLRPCYLNDASITTCEHHEQISHPVLRSFAALLARLPLVIPYTPLDHALRPETRSRSPLDDLPTRYSEESAGQATDVALISLLAMLSSTLQAAQTMDKKSSLADGVAPKRDERDLMEGSFPKFDSNPFAGNHLQMDVHG